MLRVTLKDKQQMEFETALTLLDIAKKIDAKLAKSLVAAKVNNTIKDLSFQLQDDAEIEFITADAPEGRQIMRHSASHVMAEALLQLFPGTKLVYGPTIADGFYYDIDSPHKITGEDLPKIEKAMAKLVKRNQLFIRRETNRAQALQESQDNEYKVDNINKAEGNLFSFYAQGDNFSDLCLGPHVPHTGKIGKFKITAISGSYLHGDSTSKQLTRIYGTSFATQEELDAYIKQQQEAKKRDHRKLGRDLELFEFHPEAPGMAFWRPRGTVLFNQVLNFARELCLNHDYEEIRTPTILVKDMWVKSGHWANYQDKMYIAQKDEREFGIKPMNCPGGIILYNAGLHSHNDLPIRWAEFGHVHRHEGGGEIHGLVRVRGFTQDDAHIFCTPEQLKDEIKSCIEIVFEMYKVFALKFDHIELSTRPEKNIGSEEMWQTAEKSLQNALEELDIEYKLNPGDGAFYGPKIDFHIADAIGRNWQMSTIQVDFAMPESFDMTYVDTHSSRQRPVMIHRAIAGSLERFVGVLVEHYAGDFPLWLVPEQIRVLTITETQNNFAETILTKLKATGLRIGKDLGAEKIGAKIRKAELMKIPYLAIIGKQEVEEGNIALRRRHLGNLGAIPLPTIITNLQSEINKRELNGNNYWNLKK